MPRIVLATIVIVISQTLAIAQGERNAAMLPMDIVASWKKEGAKVGWMGIGEFQALNFEDRAMGKDGDVPAFKFAVWKENVINALVAPGRDFGLDLGDTKLTDAGMKDVCRFKSLHSLDIGF